MRRSPRVLAFASTLVAALGTTGPPAQAAPGLVVTGSTATYLVVLRQAPVASYRGGIPGYPATMPAAGQRYDDARPEVTAYRSLLLGRQTRVLDRVGSPAPLYSYTTALDGFAVRLTPGDAASLAHAPGVLRVQADTVVALDDAGPPGGAAAAPPIRASGSRQRGGGAAAGRGVVVAVVDTGVWPENPSLAGIPGSPSELRRAYPGFTGECQRGDGWTAHTCDSKVLAARFFVRGFGAGNVAQSDYLSARDVSGHGTGVAAVAAGNAGVDARIAGQGFGHISGAAPAAGLSVYKACWTAPDPSHDGCDAADTVAAIDSAVEDGVDVLNYSIGGVSPEPDDAVELAFLGAAAANVFVTASAGNDGPAAGSVQHASPWVTTVGANTDVAFQGAVRLGDGRTFVGAMLSDKDVAATRLVYAGDTAADGVPPRRAALCYPGSLDARDVRGAIVVCDRGVTSRVSKSVAVEQAGGAALVLVNTRPDSVDADLQRVPTVHLDVAAGRQVKAYLARAGVAATGQLLADSGRPPLNPAPAGFSGRGPDAGWAGDVTKPDLTAPGVSVVTATSPASATGGLWDVESGTSIAAAAVSGVAAVIRGVHPSWSPTMVKSAMMTTASPLAKAGTPLARGAGELDADAVLDPGLVYDSGPVSWYQLQDGHVDASAANLASISVGQLVGRESVRRTLTNVGHRTGSYTATVRGLPGVAASVTPRSVTLPPGGTATFTVAFTAARSATYDAFTFGSLTWRDLAGRTVTSPLAVRPQLAAVPAEVTASGRSGSVTLDGRAGVTGTIHVSSSGLVGARPVSLALDAGAFDPSNPVVSAATAIQTIVVPAGARAARFAVSTARRGADVDLYVYRDGGLVETVPSTAGDATATLSRPPPGTYVVYVNAPSADARVGVTRVSLTSWVLPATGASALDLSPHSVGVTGGEPFAVSASWKGLDPGKRWWGYVAYRGLPDVTYLTVNERSRP